MTRNINRRGKDVMGYPRAKGLDGFTDDDIRAARTLAKIDGYQWDPVLTDPLVTGKRFLNWARTVRESLTKSGWTAPPAPNPRKQGAEG